MRTLIVIPARLAATRLPNKPLRQLAGRALVVRVWERISAMKLADKCIVATDDEQVATAVRHAGAECVLTGAACDSGTERVAEVARREEFRDFELIVNVQGDEPFIGAGSVRGAMTMVAGGRFELGTAAVRANPLILDDPNVVKVVTTDTGSALYFSRAPIPYHRDGAASAPRRIVLQHIGVYAYTPPALEHWVSLPPHPLEQLERLEQLRPLASGMSMGVAITDDAPAIGIDTEDDLARANAQWTELSAA